MSPCRNRSSSLSIPSSCASSRRPCAEQLLAERRQLDRAWPTGAIEHTLAGDPLERRDLLADRRLRVAQPVGGAPERALVGDRIERHEVAEFEVPELRHEHQRI